MLRTIRTCFVLLCVFWMAVLPVMPSQPGRHSASSANSMDVTPPLAGPSLQQFTAAGHVLGFQVSGVTIASPSHALRIEFASARQVEPVASQPGVAQDGTVAGFTSAQPLSQVTYRNLWDGVTLTYQAAPGGIAESVYTLEPGAALDAIRLRYNVPAKLNAGGSLVLSFAQGQMTESAPVAWQVINGQRTPVEVSFRIMEACDTPAAQVGFTVAGYDPTYPLTIDPTLLWTTGVGGFEPVDNDQAKSIAVDTSGNVFLTGFSEISWGSPERSFSYGYDAFAVKLDSSGARVWSTFLGGIGDDRGVGIAVDTNGNVLVAGTSDHTWGIPVRTYAGAEDMWAARLDPTGALLWNTFLGSAGTDYGYGIALNSSGNAFVVGYSTSIWGAPINPISGGGDAFVAKLVGSTGVLAWSTFLGGTSGDSGRAVAVTDTTVYVTGSSTATWGASPKRAYTAGSDAFVAGLNPTSGVLVWNTFLGGDGDEGGNAITLDGSGNIYVAGDDSATWGSPVRAFTTAPESFAAKLDSTGMLVWNTFLGGDGYDYTSGIAADAFGDIYVTGYTGWVSWGSPMLPFTGYYAGYAAQLNAVSGELGWNTFLNGSWGYASSFGIAAQGNYIYLAGNTQSAWGTPVNAMGGSPEAFAAQLSLSGILTWNTFMGGSDDDFILGLTMDENGNSYVVGYSNQPWGTTPVRVYSWENDAFAAKLDPAGALVWNTFLGSPLNDYGYALAFYNGNVYVTGASNGTWGSPARAFSGSTDAFVAQLDAATGVLQWNTFLGSSNGDDGYGILVDTGGNVYVTGLSTATWGSPSRAYSAGSDAFVAKLNSGGVLVWNTFLGSSGSDGAYSIAMDTLSNIYVSGNSSATWGSPARAYTASTDAFVARLANNDGGLSWNTFVGGSGLDEGMAITMDWTGNVLIAGDTSSPWAGAANHYPDGGGGNPDAYVANVNANDGSLLWTTFVGGLGSDYGTGITMDVNAGKIYLIGDTNASWGNAAVQAPQGGGDGSPAFVTQLSADGSVKWTTYLGGSVGEYGTAVAVDPGGNIYAAGYYHPAYGSYGWDGFVTKLSPMNMLYLPMLRK
jgi:hypothetical protein